MNHRRHWALFLCLAASLSLSPSYAQDADDSDPAVENAVGNVVVQDEPDGGKKIIFICRANKEQDKAPHRHVDTPLANAILDCEAPATDFKLWLNYAWPGGPKDPPSFTCYLYPSGSNVPDSDLTAALVNAFSVWTLAEAAGPADNNHPPAANIVTKSSSLKAPPRKNDSNHTISFGSLSSGTLAVTYIYITPASKIKGFDMIFNRNYPWKAYAPIGSVLPNCGVKDALYGQEYDVEHIAAHECGHVYGIDHPEALNPVTNKVDNQSADPRVTMYYAGSRGETHNRTLNDGDKTAIQARYPAQ